MNSYCLTVDFDDHLTSHYPEMSSLFNVNVSIISSTHTTKKVIDGIDKLTLNYNIVNQLSNIITETSLESYNNSKNLYIPHRLINFVFFFFFFTVFRFILKVKWGLVTLENLKFSKIAKLASTKYNIIDFTSKRLAIIRFWMIYSIQCIHSHLMTQHLATLGLQLDLKLKNSSNIDEMILIHESFLDAASDHCFQNRRSDEIRNGIEQLLNLVIVLREEWENVMRIQSAQATTLMMNSSDCNLDEIDFFHIENIEKTYVSCHRFIATTLNEEIYRNNNLHCKYFLFFFWSPTLKICVQVEK